MAIWKAAPARRPDPAPASGGGAARRRSGQRPGLTLADHILDALVAKPELHELAGRAAGYADGAGCWPVVAELAARIGDGTIGATPQAVLQYLEARGLGDLASDVQKRLLDMSDDADFSAVMTQSVEKLQAQRRFELQQQVARGTTRISDLPAEARALFASGGAPLESTRG